MLTDRPTAAELLDAIRAYRAAPARDNAAYFERVVANTLAILEREAALGPAAEAAERTRLAALLGQGGETRQLNALLVERIRAGSCDEARAALVAHLKATVADRLAIDNPKWFTPRSSS